MGSKNSNPFKDVLNEYQIIKQIQQFHITYLVHKQSKIQYLLRTLTYNDQRDYKKNILIHQARKKLEKIFHLTQLKRFQNLKVDHICSNQYKIYSLWQYSHRNLYQQLVKRKIQKRKFQEKQLWSILASTILGMNALQKNNINHQCLSTKTLLLSNQGLLKVADPITLSTISNFQALYNNRQLQNIYISPQQCTQLSAQNSFSSSSYKNDVYTMGMIMLECGLLKNQIDCYRDDCGRIDFKTLQDRLNLFRQNYSQGLKGIIQYMLRRDSRQRPDWIKLQKYVGKVDSMENYNNNNSTSYKLTNQKNSSNNNFNIGYPRSNNYSEINVNANNNEKNYSPAKNAHQNNYNFNNYQGQNLYFTSHIQNQKYKNFKNVNNNQNYQINRQYQIQNVKSNLKQQNQNLSTRNTINIGGNRDSNSNTLASGLKVVFDKKVQYTPSSIYYGQNKASFPTQKKYTNQYTYTPFDFIRSPQNTHTFSQYRSALGSQPKDYRNFNQGNVQNYQNNISLKPQQYLKNNLNIKNIQFTSRQNKIYLPSSQFTNNYQYIENKNFDIKTNFNQQKSNYTPEVLSLKISKSNKNQKNNISSNIYNATTYGIQGVTTIKSISGPPPPVDNFQYDNRCINQNNEIAYKGTQSYQTFINQQKIMIQQNKNQQQFKSPNKLSQNRNNSSQNKQQSGSLQYVIQHFKEGSRYQGSKLNGMRHGKGKFYYQDGGMYDGQWKQNKMHGYGSLYYQSGKIAYQGQWFDDQFNGIGKLHNQNPYQLQQTFDYHNFDLIDEYWVYYEGQFVQDLKHGKGKMMFSNNEYFIGNFDKDMVEGQGKFYLNNKNFVQGYWQHNHLTQMANSSD